ncbi:MAG: PaaI family thioesterase [Pseudomonadota bacterium]
MSVIRDETGAQTLLGYVVDLTDGVARSILTIGPQHTNRHGGLHGGIMAAMLDNAMGYAAALEFDPKATPTVMTVSMTTSYLAPAREGTVTATGTVTGGGRSLLFVDGKLESDAGVLLATASGVFKRIKSTP